LAIFYFYVRCTIVQSVALRLPVVFPSVCLSVTLVDQDHIGWKSWKPTACTISPTPSFFVAKGHSPTPRRTWGNFGETRGGVGKSGLLEHKSGNISETRKDRESYYGKPIGTHQCSFKWYYPGPRTASSFQRLGACNPHPKLQLLLSQERVKLWTSN